MEYQDSLVYELALKLRNNFLVDRAGMHVLLSKQSIITYFNDKVSIISYQIILIVKISNI